ncbi:MAG: cobalt-factor II C(20)-methyltransferase [Methanosarcinaceae archaeon]|nr:cobalt-factor II C(20)-methyltransferase [Methanosarcinaceae archaeon]
MLIGVGLGPGDPELITLKAIVALKKSDRVYVPGRLAADLVAPYADCEILDFPMTKDDEVLNKVWDRNAEIVAGDAKDGTVSFGLIGDPNFFSTFSHLRRVVHDRYPDIEITTIPGISSITSFASKTGTAIDSSFEVRDSTPINSKIILKARNPRDIVDSLESEGFTEFIFAERLFSNDETIIADKEKIPIKGNYFSIIYAKKGNENQEYLNG